MDVEFAASETVAVSISPPGLVNTTSKHEHKVAVPISPPGLVNKTSIYLTGSVPSGDGTTGYVPDLVRYNMRYLHPSVGVRLECNRRPLFHSIV